MLVEWASGGLGQHIMPFISSVLFRFYCRMV